MMTKRDFVGLADALRSLKPPEHGNIEDFIKFAMWKDLVQTVADLCQHSSSKFKRQRWFDYIDGKCGANGGAIREEDRSVHPERA